MNLGIKSMQYALVQETELRSYMGCQVSLGDIQDYRKVMNSSTSSLAVHPRIFRLFMKENFFACVQNDPKLNT